MRARVYLTLSPKDAALLADLLDEARLGDTEYYHAWIEHHKDAEQRLTKMHERLVQLIEAHTPSLADGSFPEPPEDYDERG